MLFLLISFLAGVLTVLAPCILPLLPVVIGSTLSGGSNKRAVTVIGSLVVSIVLFTLLIKVSTAFVTVPPETWKYISAGILLALAATMLFPSLWEKLPFIQKLNVSSNKVLGSGFQKNSFWGDVLVGASLGPVFSTCSPTYFVILATVLPASFALGLVYLTAYAIGLGGILLVISLFGQRVMKVLNIAADPNGRFKKLVGVIFILIALGILTGYDKKIQIAVLDAGFFDVTLVEQKLLQRVSTSKSQSVVEKTGAQVDNQVNNSQQTGQTVVNVTQETSEGAILPIQKDVQKETKLNVTQKVKTLSQGKYIELSGIEGYLNTGGQKIRIADYVGKKVILLSIMTYSCVNCQRTVPYLNQWYSKYEDQGLVIIGIHTPEFAYEKNIDNVKKELVGNQGVRFPVVLDNEYSTWNSYSNHYWPHRYIIDLSGNIIYDHIGEGAYAETEAVLQQELRAMAVTQ
jgi:cytochrome c biogenesis protein CcdA/thiol-disulfide isomerase/thioredoxin